MKYVKQNIFFQEQHKKKRLLGEGGVEQLDSPAPLMTAALSTEAIYLSWNGVSNATAYSVTRDGTEIYNGSDLSFQDGLKLGDELISNGDFSAWTGDNPDGFTVIQESEPNRGVTEDSGKCQIYTDGADYISLKKIGAIEVGKYYKLTFIITAASGTLRFNDSATEFDTWTTTGSKTLYFTATDTSPVFIIWGGSAGDFTIDNYSIKEVTQLPLTVNTSYDYEVIAQGTGYADSAAATATQSTLTFLPEFLFETVGLKYKETNSYGISNASNATIEKLTSLIGAQNLTFSIPQAMGFGGQGYNADYPFTLTSNNNHGDLDSNIACTDFTLCIWMYVIANYNNVFLLDDDAAAIWQSSARMQSDARIRFGFGGAGYNAYYPGGVGANPLIPGEWLKLVIQREGSNIRISRNGGTNFGSDVNVGSGTFNINRFFADTNGAGVVSTALGRMGLAKAVLTQAQCNEIFNYLRFSDYSPTSPDSEITVTGLTFSNLAATGYVDDTDLHYWATGNWSKDKVLTVGNKTFICVHQLASADFEDGIYVYDHSNGKVSNRKDLGSVGVGSDYHEHGSILEFDKRIYHLEGQPQYDIDNRMYVKKSNNNFGLGTFTEQTTFLGQIHDKAGRTQYRQTNLINNVLYAVCQENQAGTTKHISIDKSSDGLNYFERNRIITAADTAGWHYPHLCFNYNNDKLQLFINFRDTGPVFSYVFYIESSDGETWYNLARTWSKNISNNNPITEAELIANCVMKDGTASPDVMVWDVHEDAAGELYGIISKGDGTLQAFTGISGGAWAFNDIGTGAHTLASYDNNERQAGAVIWKTGAGTYSMAAMEANGGLWQVAKFDSIDDMVNWSFDAVLTTDTTHKHSNLRITKNFDHFGGGILVCTRQNVADTSTQGIWVEEI